MPVRHGGNTGDVSTLELLHMFSMKRFDFVEKQATIL